jgi:hypothetical protein
MRAAGTTVQHSPVMDSSSIHRGTREVAQQGCPQPHDGLQHTLSVFTAHRRYGRGTRWITCSGSG